MPAGGTAVSSYQDKPTLQSPAPSPSLVIGTRGSPLALKQAEEVRARLVAAHGIAPDAIAIEIIKTSGDRIQDRPLSEAGGKGLFTKEIEEALLDGRIDLAVHSAKDVPTVLPEPLELSAFLPREDSRDAFVSFAASHPSLLPEGAVIGTSSLRRGAQMRRFRPDFRVVEFRGNVGTRMRKLEDGVADATLLAMAGLNRLGEADRAACVLDPEAFMPAPAQGAICIETRVGDARVRALVSALDDHEARVTVAAERAFLNLLDGSCRTPIAALTQHAGGRLVMRGQILSPDGQQSFEDAVEGDADAAATLGRQLGEILLAAAGPDFMAALKAR